MSLQTDLNYIVLILVLMEDTLWGGRMTTAKDQVVIRLNPCFNGRYSLRNGICNQQFGNIVLILVLMEDTLWDLKNVKRTTEKSLNPCFNGRYSLRKYTSS